MQEHESGGTVERRHHFLPQFYLGNFSQGGTKSDSLWVFDLKSLSQALTKPRAVAFEKDLYRLDVPGAPPLAMEKGLACIESRAAPVIRLMVERGSLPTGEDYNTLMLFMAAAFLRAPRLRNQDFKAVSQFVERAERAAAIWRNNPNAPMPITPPLGDEPSVPLDELAQAASDRDRFTHSLHMPTMSGHIVDLARILGARKWTLWLTESAIGDFICSDSPVMLQWLDQAMWHHSPGFGLSRTIASFPLHRKAALVGAFEFENRVEKADISNVAALNTATAMSAERSLISPGKEFPIGIGGGEIITDPTKLADHIRQSRSERTKNPGGGNEGPS